MVSQLQKFLCINFKVNVTPGTAFTHTQKKKEILTIYAMLSNPDRK